MLILLSHPAFALSLGEVIQQHPANTLFPDADQISIDPNNSAVGLVHADANQIGLVYLNVDVANSVGYSGKPIYVLIALDMDGIIRNVSLLEHHEPIVLIGIPESKIRAVTDSYIGIDIVQLMRQPDRELPYDAVSGATVTVRVIDDSIVRSAMKMARRYGLGSLKPTAPEQKTPQFAINPEHPVVREWNQLVADGSVARLDLSDKDVNAAFAKISKLPTQSSQPDEPFIDLYTALVSVPAIGPGLLGDREYANLSKNLAPNQHAILVAANGPYSFKGSGYVRGGIFDRFEVVQNDNPIRFRDMHHKRLRQVEAEGAPDFQDVDLFYIPTESDFDPTAPWHLELLVNREISAMDKEFVTFALDYQLPQTYLKPLDKAEAASGPISVGSLELEDTPLWKTLWEDKTGQIVVLLTALFILSLSFFFQDWLVKRPLLLKRFRTGFLLFTLFGLGWYANAQLSVVNIFTVSNALVSGFDWSYFLMEPLIFILWGSVVIALLFWGRGAYCGWLCPFGALQELLSKLAKALHIPQIQVPWGLHERLWSLKYIAFVVLFGVSLHSLALAERMSEIEPFKTAIILKFVRDWPFVIFAVVVLGAGLFIERFYCRYVCPLGAALAIPARMRMFQWLKRYRQCGQPCQRCANDCMVQAIHPEGHINPNECVYCMNCQELYYDEHRCPVMIQKRLKRERREGKSTPKSSEIAEQILREIRAERKPDDASTP